jgi:hypothetical protein
MDIPHADSSSVSIPYVERDFSFGDFEDANWQKAVEILIDRYWSGEQAPTGRHARARILWSDTGLYVRFDAVIAEPMVIGEKSDLEHKTIGLWDRDVCEIFIAPHKNERKYFEFEIAPTGEWLDLAIDSTSGERVTDWDYDSGILSAAIIEGDRSVMAMKIEWSAFSKTPSAGDVWLGNLFRCVGKDPDRGYLAWRPTETEIPNFHVPEKFGQFVFGR